MLVVAVVIVVVLKSAKVRSVLRRLLFLPRDCGDGQDHFFGVGILAVFGAAGQVERKKQNQIKYYTRIVDFGNTRPDWANWDGQCPLDPGCAVDSAPS
jgi:hypothetical protein